MLSVLLMAIFFFLGAHLAMQTLGLGWVIPSWIKIDKWGAAIRMSWCTFFQRKAVGGTSTPDWRVAIFTSQKNLGVGSRQNVVMTCL